MSVVEDLIQARVLLVEHGWCRFGYQNADGSLCLMGAVNKATTGRASHVSENVKDWRIIPAEAVPAHDALRKTLTELDPASMGSLVHFNDTRTSATQVFALIDATLERLTDHAEDPS